MAASETPTTGRQVSCRFGADREWREFTVVGTSRRCVTLEPVTSRGDLHRVCGELVIRCTLDDDTVDAVELLGAIRHRTWIDEGRFGLGVELVGYRLSAVGEAAPVPLHAA
jgi:hypothetical protein